MIFYKIIDKKTGNKTEVNKVFFSGVCAQVYADDLNRQYSPHRFYEPSPFMYILNEEEKELYSGTIKTKKKFKKSYCEKGKLN